MALVKNDARPPASGSVEPDESPTTTSLYTYQAILIERGILVCETRCCPTPYEAARAMFDYTSTKVGEALSHARLRLRAGKADTETVFLAADGRESSPDSDVTPTSSVCSGGEVDVTVRHKPWVQAPQRLGSPSGSGRSEGEKFALRGRHECKGWGGRSCGCKAIIH